MHTSTKTATHIQCTGDIYSTRLHEFKTILPTGDDDLDSDACIIFESFPSGSFLPLESPSFTATMLSTLSVFVSATLAPRSGMSMVGRT